MSAAVPDWVDERITAYLRTNSPRWISPTKILEELNSYGQTTNINGTTHLKKYIQTHSATLHAQHKKHNGKDYFKYNEPLGGGAAAPGAAAVGANNANNEVGGNIIEFGSNAAAAPSANNPLAFGSNAAGAISRKQSRNRRRRLTRRQRKRS
jgi:hypothetical protein